MSETVGVRELRQNLSKYLARVKAGEDLRVTERGQVVAHLVPAGTTADLYTELAAHFGASVPARRLTEIAAELPARSTAAGATDAYLAEARSERA